MSLTGKVALVTGGTKGIGKATATLLVAAGAKVLINYGGDAASASQTVDELGGEEHIVALQADAGSIAGIEKMVDTCVSKFGKIDIVVANAGWLPMKTVESVTESDFDRAFGLNVKGPLFLVQKALPHMAAGSRVVLLSTSQNHASTVTPAYTLYNATKGAVEQLVRTMSKDLGSREINVNAVAPGPTGTDLFFEGKSEQMLAGIAKLSPQGRIGKPEEPASAVVWLCEPGSSWVSGQIIRVNGGMA